MNQQKDVIVIGGGMIGVSTAYYLAQQGRSVTILEKGAVCSGSSHGNAGLIANGYTIPTAAPGVLAQGLKWMLDKESPFFIKPRFDLELMRWIWKFRGACNEKQMRRAIPIIKSLGQGSLDLFDKLLIDEKIDFAYERKGRLLLFTDEKYFDNFLPIVDLFRDEYGMDSILLDAAGVREMEPNIQPAVTHGIYATEYAHLLPDRLVHELARVVKEKGVEIMTNTAVTHFRTAGQKITEVGTAKGMFEPKEVVLAAGAWSPLLAHQLGVQIPIQPAKGFSITYKRPSTAPIHPLSLSERKIAVTPMGDYLRVSSTLELAGYDPSINQRRVAALRRHVREYLPVVEEWKETAVWSGYRPSTPDDLPIIGRSNAYENLTLATGHGTLGITHGLVTGKLVSEIMEGKRPFIDLAPFRPERF